MKKTISSACDLDIDFIIQAKEIAEHVIGLPKSFSATLRYIEDPALTQDGLYDRVRNEIHLNLAKLEPFPYDELYPGKDEKDLSSEQRSKLYLLKLAFVIFHEVRHSYQNYAINMYELNEMAEEEIVDEPEDYFVTQQWKLESESYDMDKADNYAIEKDANCFATYLLYRWPIKRELRAKGDLIEKMKEQYDCIPIMPIWK